MKWKMEKKTQHFETVSRKLLVGISCSFLMNVNYITNFLEKLLRKVTLKVPMRSIKIILLEMTYIAIFTISEDSLDLSEYRFPLKNGDATVSA